MLSVFKLLISTRSLVRKRKVWKSNIGITAIFTMGPLVAATDSLYWCLSDLTSRIVAETGISSDRFHLGKIILQSLKDAPDFVLQIDAATGQSENFRSALERSVRCAVSLKNIGLKCGDVMAIIAPHYLEVAILYYSALYLGVKIAIIDPSFEVLEFEEMLKVNCPNVIFSQDSKIPVVKEALKQIDLKAKIVSFNEGSDVMAFAEFIEECQDVDINAFKPTEFNPEETIATLVPSSGTTGLPKVVVSTHKNFISSIPFYCKFPTPFDKYLIAAPAQWMSSILWYIGAPIFKYTKIHTSAGSSAEHLIEAINKYRPQVTNLTPAAVFSLINPRMNRNVDLSCFRAMSIGGSTVPKQLFDELKKIAPETCIMHSYGVTEINGTLFRHPISLGSLGSLGRSMSSNDIRLVDPETLQDITEPNVNGELWVKGPAVSKGYYNNPIETKQSFLDDGWFRSGDIFYRDEEFSFYYVDRLKLLLKYRTYHVSPAESEKVIRGYPGVLDVVVVGIPDLECGELPAACIVPHPDNPPTAQAIKDFVKEKLSEAKQLRGGVIFMDEFPLTVTSKVDRKKLKAIAVAAKRE